MVIAVITLIFVLVALWILNAVKKMNFKITTLVLVLLAFIATTSICLTLPQMHKMFSISVIDYLIKFNEDGSMSTTKQTTQTVIRKQGTQQGTANKTTGQRSNSQRSNTQNRTQQRTNQQRNLQ